jgi:hypothetical protein
MDMRFCVFAFYLILCVSELTGGNAAPAKMMRRASVTFILILSLLKLEANQFHFWAKVQVAFIILNLIFQLFISIMVPVAVDLFLMTPTLIVPNVLLLCFTK